MSAAFFKTYIVEDKECYRYTYDLEDPSLTAIPEFPFPESLVSMAYLDRGRYEPVLAKLSAALSELSKHHTQDIADQISELLFELGRVHVYFEVLRVDWQNRLAQSAQNGYQSLLELFPGNECIGLAEGITQRQQKIQRLFASVLDMDSPPKGPLVVYVTETTNPSNKYPFHALALDFEQTESGKYVEVLRPNNIFDLMEYHLRECLKRKVRMRVCKNCGRYFAVIKNSKAEYCNHPFDAKGRTCKQIASILQWNRNRADDTIFKEYRREYKKRFARMKAGSMGEEQFYLWSKLAREKKRECEEEKITLEEFERWLRDS